MSQKIVKRKDRKPSRAKKQKIVRQRRGEAASDDPVNRRLLSLLHDNARATYAEIGKKAHLSAPAVYERIRRLESEGAIRKYTVEINPAAVGLPLCAFIRIGTAGDYGCSAIAASVARNPEVEEYHSIAGEDTVLVKVRTSSPIELEYLIGRLRSIPGIVSTVTTVVLMTHFERGLQVPAGE